MLYDTTDLYTVQGGDHHGYCSSRGLVVVTQHVWHQGSLTFKDFSQEDDLGTFILTYLKDSSDVSDNLKSDYAGYTGIPNMWNPAL